MSGAGLWALLDRSARRLAARVDELESRLARGEQAAWPEFLDAVKALAMLVPALAPDQHGALLTTAEMAERLGLSAKTVLKLKANGAIRPHVQRGKLIRWRGDEIPR